MWSIISQWVASGAVSSLSLKIVRLCIIKISYYTLWVSYRIKCLTLPVLEILFSFVFGSFWLQIASESILLKSYMSQLKNWSFAITQHLIKQRHSFISLVHSNQFCSSNLENIDKYSPFIYIYNCKYEFAKDALADATPSQHTFHQLVYQNYRA